MVVIDEGDTVFTSPHSFSPDVVVLACGAYSKGSLCFTRGHDAIVRRTGNPLESVEDCDQYEAAARTLITTLGVTPGIVAHDLHADFFSTRFAERIADELGATLVAVQHHHAHAATVAVEHDRGADPFLGIVFDGYGMGDDGASWGGELLVIHDGTFERIGRLIELAVPGGDAAAREPWRMGASVLHRLGRGEEITRRFTMPGADVIRTMLEHGVRSPLTSSAGRLFDAVAGLLGTSVRMDYEAEAAIKLQALAQAHGPCEPMRDGWCVEPDGALDLLPLLERLADERDAGYGAALFHVTLAEASAAWCGAAARARGIDRVAVSGGCFANTLLRAQFKAALTRHAPTLGIDEPHRLPPDDSGISLGQARIANERFRRRR